MRYFLLCGAFLTSLLMQDTVAQADVFAKDDLIAVIFGPYLVHYTPSDNQNSFPWFTGLEWESASRWEVGGAVFSNSYYQPCGYLYSGKRWILGTEDEHLFLKMTAGALLGYVEPYEHKIPVNWNGIGIGIIPAVGYKYKRASTQIAILGVSGLMLTLGYDLWK